MVATPGDPPYGKDVATLDEITTDIAYGGSCTAGKVEDFDYYRRVLKEAVAASLALVAVRAIPARVA